jgi:hypothetical protein
MAKIELDDNEVVDIASALSVVAGFHDQGDPEREKLTRLASRILVKAAVASAIGAGRD